MGAPIAVVAVLLLCASLVQAQPNITCENPLAPNSYCPSPYVEIIPGNLSLSNQQLCILRSVVVEGDLTLSNVSLTLFSTQENTFGSESPFKNCIGPKSSEDNLLIGNFTVMGNLTVLHAVHVSVSMESQGPYFDVNNTVVVPKNTFIFEAVSPVLTRCECRWNTTGDPWCRVNVLKAPKFYSTELGDAAGSAWSSTAPSVPLYNKYMKPCGCVVDKQTDKSIYFDGLLERYFAVQMMGINQKCPPLIPIWAIVLLSVAAAVIVVMFGIFIWVKRNQGGYEELA